MDENQKKDLFSRAFIKAIAAQLGFRSSIPDIDDDSVDLILQGRGFSSGIRNPQIEVQLKCTSQNNGSDEHLKFVLPIKNYNDLRGDGLLCPRYLFVLVVPNDVGEWMLHESNYTTIMHCCYWISLMDYPDTLNTTNITIDIPKENLLTSDSLFSLMKLASIRGAA
ncbi:DUF4365 domain-containing protein [Alteromonas stellipolaris]|uniref:DUF4365 domain-containing protein n=1 Tax=Alteromonas stellipolaris TaxID=233316 RepID=UPI0026E13134|nr:DUF4365 domain-containing protein [Alteromonas stellipolaris]MDO6537411.1 DUF4365 domain-containing protein [Alteromonas stellipolaris]